MPELSNKSAHGNRYGGGKLNHYVSRRRKRDKPNSKKQTQVAIPFGKEARTAIFGPKIMEPIVVLTADIIDFLQREGQDHRHH